MQQLVIYSPVSCSAFAEPDRHLDPTGDGMTSDD